MVALEKEKCPILLLGGNHQNGKCVNWRRAQSIQLTEIYEAAKKNRDPKFLLPRLQVFKLIYARYLAEIGLAEEALQYCDVISSNLGKMGSTEFALMGRAGKTIKKDVEELSNRLKIFLNKKSVGAAVSGIASTIGSYFFSAEKKAEPVKYQKAWLPRKTPNNANSPGGRAARPGARRGATRQVNTKGDPARLKRGVRINDQPQASSPSPGEANTIAEANTIVNRGRRPSIQNEDYLNTKADPTRGGRRAVPRQKIDSGRRRPQERRPQGNADPVKKSDTQRTRFDPAIDQRRRRAKEDVPRVASDSALVKQNSRDNMPRSRSRPVISPRESSSQIEEESETTTEDEIDTPAMMKERSRAEDRKHLNPRGRSGRPPIKRAREDNAAPRARPRARIEEPTQDKSRVSPGGDVPPIEEKKAMTRVGSRGRLNARARPARARPGPKSPTPRTPPPSNLGADESSLPPRSRGRARPALRGNVRSRQAETEESVDENVDEPVQSKEHVRPPLGAKEEASDSTPSRGRPRPRTATTNEPEPAQNAGSDATQSRARPRPVAVRARAAPVRTSTPPISSPKSPPSRRRMPPAARASNDGVAEPEMKRTTSRGRISRGRPKKDEQQTEEAMQPEVATPTSPEPAAQDEIVEPAMQRKTSRGAPARGARARPSRARPTSPEETTFSLQPKDDIRRPRPRPRPTKDDIKSPEPASDQSSESSISQINSRGRLPTARLRSTRARPVETSESSAEQVSEPSMKRTTSRGRMTNPRARPGRARPEETSESSSSQVSEPTITRTGSRGRLANARARPAPARGTPPQEASEPSTKPPSDQVVEPKMTRTGSRGRMPNARARPARTRGTPPEKTSEPSSDQVVAPTMTRTGSKGRMPNARARPARAQEPVKSPESASDEVSSEPATTIPRTGSRSRMAGARARPASRARPLRRGDPKSPESPPDGRQNVERRPPSARGSGRLARESEEEDVAPPVEPEVADQTRRPGRRPAATAESQAPATRRAPRARRPAAGARSRRPARTRGANPAPAEQHESSEERASDNPPAAATQPARPRGRRRPTQRPPPRRR